MNEPGVVNPAAVEAAGADPTDLPPSKWAQYRKGIVAAVNALITVLTVVLTLTDVIPANWLPYIAGALAVLNAIATYLTKNAPTEAQVLAIKANPAAQWY